MIRYRLWRLWDSLMTPLEWLMAGILAGPWLVYRVKRSWRQWNAPQSPREGR